MTKKQMQQMVVENLESCLPKDRQWEVQYASITKENNEIVDAVSVSCNNNVSMLVHIDRLCEQYDRGIPFDIILANLAEQLSEELPQYVSKTADNITNFKMFKDRVFASLINTAMNKSRLANVPHRNIEDLSVTYRILVDSDDESNLTLIINNQLLDEWNITEEDLFKLAMENTKKLFPVSVRGMIETLKDMLELPDENDVEEEMYVISNKQGVRGAIYMFDTKLLTQIAKRLNTDRLYVFPSSVHEAVVCSYGYLSSEDANELVASINHDVVLNEDVLSDHAYLFDKKTMTVTSL